MYSLLICNALDFIGKDQFEKTFWHCRFECLQSTLYYYTQLGVRKLNWSIIPLIIKATYFCLPRLLKNSIFHSFQHHSRLKFNWLGWERNFLASLLPVSALSVCICRLILYNQCIRQWPGLWKPNTLLSKAIWLGDYGTCTSYCVIKDNVIWRPKFPFWHVYFCRRSIRGGLNMSDFHHIFIRIVFPCLLIVQIFLGGNDERRMKIKSVCAMLYFLRMIFFVLSMKYHTYLANFVSNSQI